MSWASMRTFLECAVTSSAAEPTDPALRKEFLRDGALNAMWKAWSTHMAIGGIEEAERDDQGLAPDKVLMRRQLLALSKQFLMRQLTQEMDRALEELRQWKAVE